MSAPQMEAPRKAALRQLADRLDRTVADDPAGSLSAVVLHGDAAVWTHACGWANHEQGVLAGAETIYRVGSITKCFTVACTLRLMERARLDLDNPVADYVDEIQQVEGYSALAAPITLRDLCSHTSGLAREPQIMHPVAGAVADWERLLLDALPATRFAHPCGTCFEYSNIGVALVGLAIQRATDRPYMQLIAEEICEPLGLEHTGFLPPSGNANLATGYERLADGTVSGEGAKREHVGRGFRVPGGGLYSTPLEIARFIAALHPQSQEHLLQEATRWRFLSTTSRKSEECSPGPSNAYGLGTELYLRDLGSEQDPELLAYGHHGDMTGYAAVCLCDPARQLTLAICSSFRGSEDIVAEQSIDLLRAL